jgi:mannitol/fructose-specific phosphotransferase system IIA component
VGPLPADLPAVLAAQGIRLAQHAVDKTDALRRSGALLVELGAVEPGYADAMLEREDLVTTYVGEGFAIPHGTNESRVLVRRTALGFLQFPDGVDWGDGTVQVCIPIAASGGEHMALLSALAETLLDPDAATRLRSATSADDVLAILAPPSDGSQQPAAQDEFEQQPHQEARS